MAELKVKDIAVALCKGNVQTRFGKTDEDANELIRRAILRVAGCEEGWDMYAFQENKFKVFRLLSEILTETVGRTIIDQYQSWVEIKDEALGDMTDFKVMDDSLFEVGYVADGTRELRRQRLVHGKVAMSAFPLGVKIYEEFDSFRLGRIDFPAMIQRVADSMDNAIAQIIVKGIENAYTELGSQFVIKGSYDDDKMTTLIQRVEAKTGKKAVIYGTKRALSQLRKSSNASWADADKNDIREQGYVGKFNGTDVVEIPQSVDLNSEFIISDDFMYVIPEGTKIVKLRFEGDAYVEENTSETARKDMQIEYQFNRKIQLGVLKSNVYGVYGTKLS